MKEFNGQTVYEFLCERGFGEKVFVDFEEAKKSNSDVAVVIHNDDSFFDLYIVGVKNNQFGEYASWSASEFEEYEELVEMVLKFVQNILKSDSPIGKIKELNANLKFTPYEAEEIR